MRASARPTASRGRTLVELLVSMAIGLVIAAFVAGIYLSSAQTARIANQAATIEDSGRTVMTLIGNSLRQAGYGEIVGTTVVADGNSAQLNRVATLFDEERHLVGCSNGAAGTNARLDGNWADVADPGIAINCATSGGGAMANPVSGNDAVMVRYQGDTVRAAPQGVLNDCVGVAAPLTPFSTTSISAGHSVTSRPIVQNMYFVDGGALRCNGNGSGAAGRTEELISNVEQFKVYYGYDDVRAGGTYESGGKLLQPTVRSIRDAAYLSAAGNASWDSVVAVYVCLVIRSDATERGVTTSTGAAATYRRCPLGADEVTTTAGPIETPNTDGVLRRTYFQVFNVRARSSFDPAY